MATTELTFTGECMLPGKTPARVYEDHVERYRFAARFCGGKRVLDIACGSGYGSAMLADAGAESVLGVDISSDNVAYASEHYARSSIRFDVGDIVTYEPDGQFDLITSFETIEHVPDYQGALINLRKLMRDGGALLISSPNRRVTSPGAHCIADRPLNKFHAQEFTPRELRAELMRAGIADVDRRVYGQRLRPRFVWGNGIYNRLFNPNSRASSKVRWTCGLSPRYFILIATRH
jgi:SAM-dependent methyltransferase